MKAGSSLAVSRAVLLAALYSAAQSCLPSPPDERTPPRSDARPRADAGAHDAGAIPDAGATDAAEAPDAALEAPRQEAERLFPSEDHPVERYPACHLASPLRHASGDDEQVLLAVGHELIAADPLTGARRWGVTLPAPTGELAFVVATPLLLPGGDRAAVSYHTTDATAGSRDVMWARHRHRLVVVDLNAGAIDPSFPTLELSGEAVTVDGAAVPFDPAHALGRAQLVGARLPGDALGKLYVTFGNARDIQPWHGFAFEIDLDLWLASGAGSAISGFFVSTPEADCGPPGLSGSRERRCGGGLWAPSGPLILPSAGSYEVVLASGNGQLDLDRRDYANTLMRAGPGLAFEPGCDPLACAAFDPDAPASACAASCSHLFLPRMPPGEDFASLVSDDRCAGLTMLECWAELDYIGGSTPIAASVGGFEVLLYPAKDGAVYLLDRHHFGTLYERRQLVPVCGTPTAPCAMDWAGMIVTQPTLTEVDGEPLALVPTFMPDAEQEAGVIALRLVLRESRPALEEAWRWPPAGSALARERFRSHPSRVALLALEGGGSAAVLVEPRTSGSAAGRLLALDVATGALLLDAPLEGRGYRFVMPLVVDDRVYVPTCHTNAGDAWLEAYRIAPAP